MSQYTRTYDWFRTIADDPTFPAGSGTATITQADSVANVGTKLVLHGAHCADVSGTAQLTLMDAAGVAFMEFSGGAAAETPTYQNLDIILLNGLRATSAGAATVWLISFTILRPAS